MRYFKISSVGISRDWKPLNGNMGYDIPGRRVIHLSKQQRDALKRKQVGVKVSTAKAGF